jgi:heavy metal sensor kinase
MMFRELRWRLTGLYVVLLLGALLLFGAGTYLAARAALMENFDEVLVDQASFVAQAIDIEDGVPELKQEVLLSGHRSDDHFTRLYTLGGTLVFDDTTDGPRVPDLLDTVATALRGEKSLTQVETSDDTLRVATFPILYKGRIAGVLQVGVSLSDIQKTLGILLIILLIMAPVTVALTSGGGLFLANRALAPIDAITRTAQRISVENLNRRIGVVGPDDEVGRLARTFDMMLTRLEEAFTRQRQFVADASHELRTPLTAIIGQIDVALGWPESVDYYRSTLVAVREQAHRLTRLASDLLFLARADAEATPNTGEAIDLGSLLPAVIIQAQPLAAERQQTIAVTSKPAGIVHGNEDYLIHLFLNLLDNAIRYTPPNGQITLDCNRTSDTVRISVGDTGPGIAPEHLARVFDRFYRVDRGRSRAQGGSGLGLAIAQSIAQLHGGRIIVESMIGQGSTFTVVLPVSGAPSQVERTPGAPIAQHQPA